MQLFNSDATISSFFFNFAYENSKVPYLWHFGFFFSAALTAQNSPELKIHVRNVAQDTSVYYSVAYTM